MGHAGGRVSRPRARRGRRPALQRPLALRIRQRRGALGDRLRGAAPARAPLVAPHRARHLLLRQPRRVAGAPRPDAPPAPPAAPRLQAPHAAAPRLLHPRGDGARHHPRLQDGALSTGAPHLLLRPLCAAGRPLARCARRSQRRRALRHHCDELLPPLRVAAPREPPRRPRAALPRAAAAPPCRAPRSAPHDQQLQHHLPHLRPALRDLEAGARRRRDAGARRSRRAMKVESAARINLRWISLLRWGAVAGQVITILLAGRFLLRPLPVAAMLSVCAALSLANVALLIWLARGGRPTDRASALNLLADIGALTALLALSGGSENPFAVLYLVHITIGAVILPARWSIFVAAASVVAFSALQVLPAHELAVAGDASALLLRARFIAFVVAAAFISTFSLRMSRSLRLRGEELDRARSDAEATERLAALGTLAAGTAHELNTPLGTIQVLAGRRACRPRGGPPPGHAGIAPPTAPAAPP